ncbi:MAG: hypothetical protein LBU37_06440 [Tannerellaceae bacterium]|jgi:hypothetical protein|nr:hypothetical protein [Tannerellaceae bacterium]
MKIQSGNKYSRILTDTIEISHKNAGFIAHIDVEIDREHCQIQGGGCFCLNYAGSEMAVFVLVQLRAERLESKGIGSSSTDFQYPSYRLFIVLILPAQPMC